MRFFPRKALVLFLVLGFAGKAWSGSGAFPDGQPIDTRMDLGLFGLLGGGMSYSVGGRRVTRYQDFKELIYPLRDEAASGLIRDAEECHFAADILYVTGVGTGADVALFFKPTPFLRVDWFDRIATGVVAAEFFWGVGVLLDTSAEGHKYNAVQRYNQLLSKKDQAFLELKPQLTLTQQGPGLGLGCRF